MPYTDSEIPNLLLASFGETVAKSLDHMRQLGVLREITGRQRHRLFVYDAYLAILSDGTEPIR